MREPCLAFRKAQVINSHLDSCPADEIQVIRPLSGHGGKVCEACRTKNRKEQRKRENAQKRARRAKLKRNKMTAGIGAGNVVWTAPKIWSPNVVDAQTLALHSPPTQRINTLKVRSTTQALQYALSGSLSTATMTQNHVDVSHHEHGIYSRSHQLFAATTSNILHPQEKGHDTIVTELRDDTQIHHHYESEPQDLSATLLDGPLYEDQKHQPVGLGISMPNDAKWGQYHPETCSFNEWSFRMELNEWSTVFDDDDHPYDNKEL